MSEIYVCEKGFDFEGRAIDLVENIQSELFSLAEISAATVRTYTTDTGWRFDTGKCSMSYALCGFNFRDTIDKLDEVKRFFECHKYGRERDVDMKKEEISRKVYRYYMPLSDEEGNVSIRNLYSFERYTSDELLEDPYTIVNFSWNEDCHDIEKTYDCQYKKNVFNHRPSKVEVCQALCERYLEYSKECHDELEEPEGDYEFTRDEYANYSRLYKMFRTKLLKLKKEVK